MEDTLMSEQKHVSSKNTKGSLGCPTSTIVTQAIYSCCCRSTYAIDRAPTDAGGACKISSQRTRARATRDCTILITI